MLAFLLVLALKTIQDNLGQVFTPKTGLLRMTSTSAVLNGGSADAYPFEGRDIRNSNSNSKSNSTQQQQHQQQQQQTPKRISSQSGRQPVWQGYFLIFLISAL